MSRGRVGRCCRALGLCAVLLLAPAFAHAGTDAAHAASYREAVSAIQRGAYGEAIDQLEGLADRGFLHPDASFNRAVAYLGRAQTGAAHPGDLGRAAAALSEVLVLRPDDDEAERGLTVVREEIARRRARQGAEAVSVRPALLRAVTSLFDESIWAALAALGALLVSAGLGLRWLGKTEPLRLTGAISLGIGAFVLSIFGTFATVARHYRLTTEPAVVVVPEARWLGADGRPRRAVDGTDAITEGAGVFLLERQGSLARVQWGTTEGWVQSSQLRVLARP